jgi:hypothetical protein
MASDVIRLFVGWDEREEVGSHVFLSSLMHNSSLPVSITHLKKSQVANLYGTTIKEGSNAFTWSRFLVPALCDFSGFALFVDGADMMATGDIADIWRMQTGLSAVQVVPHNYQSKHPRKYVGTGMEAVNTAYERKNWASVMLMFCGHMAWRKITPQWLEKADPLEVLQLRFLEDRQIGFLPENCNVLVDEDQDCEQPIIAHWTAGVPGFPAYADAPMAEQWHAQLKRVNHAID